MPTPDNQSGASITLNTALPTEVHNQIQFGVTTVMNHGSGDSYIFTAANDQWISNTWTQYRGSLSGEQWGAGTDHFRKGTAFVQVAVLADWTNSGAMLVIDEIHFTKVSDTYVTNSSPIGSDPAQIVSKPWTERILLAASDTGQEREPDLGLYYMGGRWMHPDTGRFDQVDPPREFWNSYSYVGNNPVLFNDPSGECIGCDFYPSFFKIAGSIVGPMSRDQFYSDNLGISARWNIDGHWFGQYELDAYKSGLPSEFIYQSRNYSEDQVVEGMDVFEVTYDGFGNEINRFNKAKERAFMIASGILGRVIFRKGRIIGPSLNRIPVPKGLSKNIHWGKQGKHIRGQNNFDPDRSPIKKGINPQKLLDGVHNGNYQILRVSPRNQPVVNFGRIIGNHKGKPTSMGIIHNGKNGAHIVPTNPRQWYQGEWK